MRVRAKVTGFAGGSRRRPGDVFTIDSNDPKAFSEKWMETVSPPAPTEEVVDPPAKPERKAGGKAVPKKEKPTGDAEVI